MTAQLVAFPSRLAPQVGWSNEELAELYRVEHALIQAGMQLDTDYGQTDEGDPWFIFCRSNGEILVHIARFDGLYRLFSPALAQPLTGYSFSTLTKSFLGTVPVRSERSSHVVLHPAALLSVLVLTIFYAADLATGNGVAEAAEASTANGADATMADLTTSSPHELWLGVPTPNSEKAPLKAVFGSYISTLSQSKNEAAPVSSNGYLMLVTSVIGFASVLHESTASQFVAQAEDVTGAAHKTAGGSENGTFKIQDIASHTLLNELSAHNPDFTQHPQPFAALPAADYFVAVPHEANDIATIAQDASGSIFDLHDIVQSNHLIQQAVAVDVADLAAALSSIANRNTGTADEQQTIVNSEAETAVVVLAVTGEDELPVEAEVFEGKTTELITAESSVVQQVISQNEITAAQVDAFIDASLDVTRRGAFDYDDLMGALETGSQTIQTSRLTVSEILMFRDAERSDSSFLDLEARLQIDQFLRESTDAEVLVRNGSILIYDAADVNGLESAEIVSWDLAAGGSIALLGHFDALGWAV